MQEFVVDTCHAIKQGDFVPIAAACFLDMINRACSARTEREELAWMLLASDVHGVPSNIRMELDCHIEDALKNSSLVELD